MVHSLSRVGSFLSQILGSICPLCHEQTQNTGFCQACQSDFYHESSVCPICAELSPNAQLCGRCQKKMPNFNALFVSFDLSEVLLNLIHAYKYQRNMQLCGALAQLMLTKNPHFSLEEIDFIVSVPISEQHLWHRGFNQSHLLAKSVGKHYNKPLLPEHNFTRAERPHQATLKYKERQKNVKNVFAFTGKHTLANKTLLIVDVISNLT